MSALLAEKQRAQAFAGFNERRRKKENEQRELNVPIWDQRAGRAKQGKDMDQNPNFFQTRPTHIQTTGTPRVLSEPSSPRSSSDETNCI